MRLQLLSLYLILKHQDISNHQSSAQVLLLSINNVPSAKAIITGKIFEYLQVKRPILAIGPEDGDAALILKNTNAGEIFDFKNKVALKAHILKLYSLYKKNTLKADSKNIQHYHRKELTSQLAKVINKLVS